MGNRLRELRQSKGLSQAELGRRIRVDPSLIRRIEGGYGYAYPKLRRGVSRVLGVPASEIFPESDKRKPAAPAR